MFELSFVKKYLTPRKNQLSISLIACMSVGVISLVVWLVVVFLSVTEGIEQNWLKKLTALNAPIRLQPTEKYYSSYYYNIDKYSSASKYMARTIGQKARSLLSDPFNPENDAEIPLQMMRKDVDGSGNLKDPIKGAIGVLETLKKNHTGIVFQDVELSGALLKIQLLRPDPESGLPMESQLTHVSYLASFAQENPSLQELLLPPTVDDLNHLLYLSMRSPQKEVEIAQLLQHMSIQKVKPKGNLWQIPIHLLPEKVPFAVEAYVHGREISHVIIPNVSSKNSGILEKRQGRIFFSSSQTPEQILDGDCPIFAERIGPLQATVNEKSQCLVSGLLQKHKIHGITSLDGLEIIEGAPRIHYQDISSPPPWFFYHKQIPVLPKIQDKWAILLPKQFRENGLRIGDHGFLSYPAQTSMGMQEMHIPIFVGGFYDPGIMAVGNKCILAPSDLTQTINASESAFTLEKTQSNALLVWFPKMGAAAEIKTEILKGLKEKGIDQYWQVQTFREYDFARDLLQQFQSDKYLFTLIGIIILLVASANIISLLSLLVSDKKKEIGILQAMGAKKRSIAGIFGLCGISLGLLSCILGISLAFFTLKNMDGVVHILSSLQGHETFHAQFFGQSLPKQLSSRALWFAGVATPLIALFSGLFPALKAARMNPCETLRSK